MVDYRITINDVLPTIAAALGFENINGDDFDGVNQWAYLSGNGEYVSADYIVHGTYGKEAYYQDHWKLLASSNNPPELYDLQSDPFESINVAPEHMELVETMLNKLEAFPRGKSVHDPIWKALLDMDFFGGESDRLPYAGIEGVNGGPVHPILYVAPLLITIILGLVYFKKHNSQKITSK
jgi:hypothetical protein